MLRGRVTPCGIVIAASCVRFSRPGAWWCRARTPRPPSRLQIDTAGDADPLRRSRSHPHGSRYLSVRVGEYALARLGYRQLTTINGGVAVRQAHTHRPDEHGRQCRARPARRDVRAADGDDAAGAGSFGIASWPHMHEIEFARTGFAYSDQSPFRQIRNCSRQIGVVDQLETAIAAAQWSYGGASGPASMSSRTVTQMSRSCGRSRARWSSASAATSGSAAKVTSSSTHPRGRRRICLPAQRQWFQSQRFKFSVPILGTLGERTHAVHVPHVWHGHASTRWHGVGKPWFH